MKQVLQDIHNGTTHVEELPSPTVRVRHVLIDTSQSLISSGTERMLVDFGRAGWFDKARKQPDKVRMVLDRMRTDGLLSTFDAVISKLDQPIAPGYCNVGVVFEAGAGVSGFSVGDRVVSNGPHAARVCVSQNLCARVPDGVPDDHAVFAVLGAIGLQGVRLAEVTLGECVVVTGLGLIGLLTVQILRAHGCRVLGLDFDRKRLALAESFGAATVNLAEGRDPLAAAQSFSRGRGVDAVLIASSGTDNEPIRQAAAMCRKRGRIVLIGVTGLELSRADFYEKELSFQVSCSYGPGRYDPAYEEEGRDYPVGFVRWTEQRNFEAVLDLMAAGQLDVEPLISHRFGIDDAPRAYDTLLDDKAALGILLQYGAEDVTAETSVQLASPAPHAPGAPVAGVIGGGNYAGRVLLPALLKGGASMNALVTRGGATSAYHGKKFGFSVVDTNADSVFEDPSINLVVVATRHDSHARYACDALRAGKNVFVEKPLCLDLEELDAIRDAARSSTGFVMVGFNRRFSPLTRKLREMLATTAGPKSMIMTVNAGAIPADHWTRDPAVGGGRILGEACHFVDLLRFVAGAEVADWSITGTRPSAGPGDDGATISLRFADGSIGAIHYLTSGHRRFGKERLEVFVDGRTLRLDNFLRLDGWGWDGFRRLRLWRQDKGQQACVDATLEAVRNGADAPIPFGEIVEVSRLSIELARACR